MALETYFHWLATGAPVNQAMPGRGYAKLETPLGGYDPERPCRVMCRLPWP
ncbi:hypothetical protein GCM10007159_11640 [Modicisalibacter luteus]|nr:hypothetical protein GCM10007159_11640 [Halomonas lutea]